VGNLRIATINIPNAYLDCMETLIGLGFFPSRSECVRECLKHFLMRETFINENLKHENFEKMKKKQRDVMIH